MVLNPSLSFNRAEFRPIFVLNNLHYSLLMAITKDTVLQKIEDLKHQITRNSITPSTLGGVLDDIVSLFDDLQSLSGTIRSLTSDQLATRQLRVTEDAIFSDAVEFESSVTFSGSVFFVEDVTIEGALEAGSLQTSGDVKARWVISDRVQTKAANIDGTLECTTLSVSYRAQIEDLLTTEELQVQGNSTFGGSVSVTGNISTKGTVSANRGQITEIDTDVLSVKFSANIAEDLDVRGGVSGPGFDAMRDDEVVEMFNEIYA